MLNLLTEFHLVFLLNIFQVAFLIHIVLHLSNNVGHFSCNNTFILSASCFPDGLLFKIEVCFLPSPILVNAARYSFIELNIKERSIDLHNILRKGWLGQKSVRNKSLSGFQKSSEPDVFFPNSKDFGNGISFEETNICNDIEQGGLVHPIR